MRQGSIVKITRPRYPHDGKSFFLNKTAKVAEISGTRLSLVLPGETERYRFWISEVDLVEL